MFLDLCYGLIVGEVLFEVLYKDWRVWIGCDFFEVFGMSEISIYVFSGFSVLVKFGFLGKL